MAQVVSIKNLLEAGAHFGHQTKRWNPKMKRYIFTERNGIYIIDLTQTLAYIDRAYDFVKETVAHGGTVLFIGTKRQAQEAIADQATRVGMPYVNQRWLGGMLTNFSTVYKRLQRLKELEQIETHGTDAVMTKKEALVLQREKEKLAKTLGGIRDMTKVPSVAWIVDTNKEHIAVDECRKLHIPIVAILDTNCDPDVVDYKIPANDDAIRSAQLLSRVIADAVAEGLQQRAALAAGAGREGEQVATGEPLAAWETEQFAGTADQALASGEAAAAAETAGVGDAVEGAGWSNAGADTASAPAPEAVTPEAVTPEAVTPEAVAPDAVTPEAVTSEAVTPPAPTDEVAAQA